MTKKNLDKFKTKEFSEKMRLIRLGKKMSEDTKLKIGIKMKGRSSWVGKHHSLETKIKLSKIRKGMKCFFWKGGVSNNNRTIRHQFMDTFEYKLWRASVFQRDNYTCVWCGLKHGWNKEQKRKIDIQADHIQPYLTNPELRLAIDNGRTLCKECHIKRHKKSSPVYRQSDPIPRT